MNFLFENFSNSKNFNLLVNKKVTNEENLEFIYSIKIKYDEIYQALIIKLDNISDIVYCQEIKAQIKFKNLFFNKFSHDFKNPLLNISQISKNVINIFNKKIDYNCKMNSHDLTTLNELNSNLQKEKNKIYFKVVNFAKYSNPSEYFSLKNITQKDLSSFSTKNNNNNLDSLRVNSSITEKLVESNNSFKNLQILINNEKEIFPVIKNLDTIRHLCNYMLLLMKDLDFMVYMEKLKEKFIKNKIDFNLKKKIYLKINYQIKK